VITRNTLLFGKKREKEAGRQPSLPKGNSRVHPRKRKREKGVNLKKGKMSPSAPNG